MTKTINDLTAITSADIADFIAIWRAANGDTRKITKGDFIGATLTGGGSIVTGGHTLTVESTSTINGSLDGDVDGNMTGGGTVATGGFDLTVPATGTAALRGTAQTFTALQTFSAGIAFANETLSAYDEGTWTPTITGTTNPTVTYTSQSGQYLRINNWVFYQATIVINTISGGTGNARFSVPLTVSLAGQGTVALVGIDVAGTPFNATISPQNGQTYGLVVLSNDNATTGIVQCSGLAAGDTIVYSGFYIAS